MKSLLWVAGILLVLGLAIAGLQHVEANKLFERQVYADRAAAQDLKTGQASCMHCPMYYRFNTSPDVIQKIVVQRELEAVVAMPEFMEQTISLFKEDWWIDAATLARSKKYWVRYESVGGESRMRLALIDKNTVYFASTGFPEVEKYRKVPLADQPLGNDDFLQRK